MWVNRAAGYAEDGCRLACNWSQVARSAIDQSMTACMYYRVEVNKCNKGIWWMPWRREAMKDVVRCEKLRGGANNL
jgi:hypothetical protein